MNMWCRFVGPNTGDVIDTILVKKSSSQLRKRQRKVLKKLNKQPFSKQPYSKQPYSKQLLNRSHMQAYRN